MTEHELLILASLAGGPRHGYSIMRDIEHMANVRLGPGTLYGAIPRLVDQGLIEALETDDRRRPYRLTRQGSEILRTRMEAMRDVSLATLGRLKEAT